MHDNLPNVDNVDPDQLPGRQRWVQKNTKPNRAQKRQKGKRRGIGWTRQFSSARARGKNGTPCLGDAHHRLLEMEKLMREMAKIQANMDTNKSKHFGHPTDRALTDEELKDAAEFLAGENSLTGEDLHHEEANTDALAEALAQSSAKGLIADIKSGTYDHMLAELRAAEEVLKNRKTVLAAIDARE